MKQDNTMELLKPRYKVINNWPENNTWNVGDIILFNKCEHGYFHECWNGSQKTIWYENYKPRIKYSFDTYPHLFRKLEWWEDRKIEEMPGYVKVDKSNFRDDSIEKGRWEQPYYFKSINGKGFCAISVTPATEAEYLTYINQLK